MSGTILKSSHVFLLIHTAACQTGGLVPTLKALTSHRDTQEATQLMWQGTDSRPHNSFPSAKIFTTDSVFILLFLPGLKNTIFYLYRGVESKILEGVFLSVVLVT